MFDEPDTMTGTSLIFDDGVRDRARTHVFIIGVGSYEFGAGPKQSEIAGGLAQLTSPTISARAVADWFQSEFRNPGCPLGTVTVLLSEAVKAPVAGQDGRLVDVPEATLANVRTAMLSWRSIIQCHPDNMIVFYFCGHGISLGQKAALLLNDFGDPAASYDAAIELDELTGTLKNAAAAKQLFLIDCCRSKADEIYSNETRVGSRVLSIVPNSNHNGVRRRQCVIFPTIDGEQAFGVPGQVSVFTTCFLDAVRFAAFDDKTGPWVSTSLLILNAIDELVSYRLPAEKRNKAVPTSLDAMGFEFNEIEAPTKTRSIVTIDDRASWSEARLMANDVSGTKPSQTFDVPNNHTYRCWTMDLEFGEWEFSGKLAVEPPRLSVMRRYLTRPMVFVRLGVE